MDAIQDEDKIHYSSGIPSKEIEDYELLKTFNSFDALNEWLDTNDSYKNLSKINQDNFNNAKNRDVFGDYIVPLKNKNHDLAIKQAGDFLLYFNSDATNEVRELVKSRTIWDQFVEGNYRTAEPGLIFWTTMSKYSPSNYVGRPIICTNPCAEVPLEDGGACNLGSINLSRFVNEDFRQMLLLIGINWLKLQ